MNQNNIEILLRTGILRRRQPDLARIKSIVILSEINVKIIKTVELNENSATLIFREMYESLRELGDAAWWSEGFEPQNHEISIDILKEFGGHNLECEKLSRFRKIRNDANYRGFKATVSQTKEIIEFWDKYSRQIINELQKKTLLNLNID